MSHTYWSITTALWNGSLNYPYYINYVQLQFHKNGFISFTWMGMFVYSAFCICNNYDLCLKQVSLHRRSAIGRKMCKCIIFCQPLYCKEKRREHTLRGLSYSKQLWYHWVHIKPGAKQILYTESCLISASLNSRTMSCVQFSTKTNFSKGC